MFRTEYSGRHNRGVAATRVSAMTKQKFPRRAMTIVAALLTSVAWTGDAAAAAQQLNCVLTDNLTRPGSESRPVCTTRADISQSSAWTGYASPPSCSAIDSACSFDGRWSLSKDIQVADDYCNTRCDQQFNYCRYRGDSLDRCNRRLATCRARC